MRDEVPGPSYDSPSYGSDTPNYGSPADYPDVISDPGESKEYAIPFILDCTQFYKELHVSG